VDEEHALDLALVAMIGGTRPTVTVAELQRWLAVRFGIPGDSVKICRYFPEDILITFSSYDDMVRVLHDRPPVGTPLTIIFKRWRRQALASAENLYYRVTVAVRGLPAHTWHLSTVRQLLSPACSNLQPTPATLSKEDLRRFTVVAWCIHPDLIPREKVMYVPEPEVTLPTGVMTPCSSKLVSSQCHCNNSGTLLDASR
jgi:hypothetical protein